MTRRKAGRKRKAGHRDPSGDIVRDTKLSRRAIADSQPHRRCAPLEAREDQRAETPLGILNMIGAISHKDYAAGRRFARIVRRYLAVLSAPNASPSSIAGIMEPKGAAHEITDPEVRRDEYTAAHDALLAVGRAALVVVGRMAVYGEPCPEGAYPALSRGLRALQAHFELTDQAKSRYSGNRG